MVLNEDNLQSTLKFQENTLLQSHSFTPYLRWAPKNVAKYKRIKGTSSESYSRNMSLLKAPTLDVNNVELMLYEDILKDQIDRGRNLIKKYKTSTIEIIAEREDEGYESDESIEYKKDSATTTSSAGNKTEHRIVKNEENAGGLIKKLKRGSTKIKH